MTVHHENLTVRSEHRLDTMDITARVRSAVTRSAVRQGMCTVTSLHTTAGLFINENADPNVRADLLSHLGKLVPIDEEFSHAEGNADAHIKTVLMGNAITCSVRDGELVLGEWQGIFFAEFDGPRDRNAAVTVIGDDAG